MVFLHGNMSGNMNGTSLYDAQAMVTCVFLDGNMNGSMNGNILIRRRDDGNIVFSMVT